MQRLCNLNDLPEQSTRGFQLDGQEVIVCRWDGQIHVWLNDCPHAGWPLNFEPDGFLDSEGRYLQCHNHMALFEIDTGNCIAGPCVGCGLTAVEWEFRGEDVFATVPDEESPDS